jgi:hypothetical protein
MKYSQLLLLLALVPCSMQAQEGLPGYSEFSGYAYVAKHGYNITCKMPKKFSDLKFLAGWKITEKCAKIPAYSPVLQSDDKECMLLYTPMLPGDSEFVPNVSHKQGLAHDIKIVNGILDATGWPDAEAQMNLSDWITANGAGEIKRRFNADSVFTYSFTPERPVEGKYNHCIDMVISKPGRASVSVMWLFTDAGYRHRNRYIKRLNRNIWYDDGAWTFDKTKTAGLVHDFAENSLKIEYLK